MKQKVLDLLKERHEINITEFPKLIPEAKGKYSIFMPVKQGINPNILWVNGVTEEFIDVFNELLIDKRLIEWKPSNILMYIADNSPIYTEIDLFKKKYLKKQIDCWLPITIILKSK